jgi:hypothetical protein
VGADARKLFGDGDSSGASRNRIRADQRCEGADVSFGRSEANADCPRTGRHRLHPYHYRKSAV